MCECDEKYGDASSRYEEQDELLRNEIEVVLEGASNNGLGVSLINLCERAEDILTSEEEYDIFKELIMQVVDSDDEADMVRLLGYAMRYNLISVTGKDKAMIRQFLAHHIVRNHISMEDII